MNASCREDPSPLADTPPSVMEAEAARLVELHASTDTDASGTVELSELRGALRRGAGGGVYSDDELKEVDAWLDAVYAGEGEHAPLDFLEFCRVFLGCEAMLAGESAPGGGAGGAWEMLDRWPRTGPQPADK